MSALPKGWSIARIGELCADEPNAITDGPYGSNLKTSHYRAEGPRVIRLGNIGAGEFLHDDVAYIAEDHFRALAKHHVLAGDILIAALGDPLGRACIAPAGLGPALVKADCFRVRLSPKLSARLIADWLNSEDARVAFSGTAHGLGRVRINLSDLRSTVVPVPPYLEQQRIVGKIAGLTGKSERARAHLDHIPRLVEKYKQAILAAAFRGELIGLAPVSTELPNPKCWNLPTGWRWVMFSEAAEIVADLVKPDLIPELPHIAPDNVESGTGRLLPYRTIEEDKVISPKHRFKPGQVIYSKIRPYLRKAVIVDFEGACSADMYPLSPKDGVSGKFLLYWLISEQFAAFTLEHEGRTVLPKINQIGLDSTPFPLATFSSQQEIANRIDSAFSWIDRLATETTSARKLIDQLDQAILARAFRGELVPQDPNDEPASVLLERIRESREAAPAGNGRRGRARASA
jgi:type I restriction enzyme, S subunit